MPAQLPVSLMCDQLPVMSFTETIQPGSSAGRALSDQLASNTQLLLSKPEPISPTGVYSPCLWCSRVTSSWGSQQ